MIPEFPCNIRIRLARFKFFCCFSKLRQPTGQRQSNIRTQQKNYLIGPILFLYYEESLVSSNLNLKLFRFHCVRPNEHAKRVFINIKFVVWRSSRNQFIHTKLGDMMVWNTVIAVGEFKLRKYIIKYVDFYLQVKWFEIEW